MPFQTTGINYTVPNFGQMPYQMPVMGQNGYNGYPAYPQMPQTGIPQYTQPQPQPKPVTGKVVSSEQDITANDVPMDNSVSLFPTDDYSCIYAKQWTSDGKIKTIKFVPQEMDGDFQPSQSFEDEMRTQLSEIKDLLTNQRGKQYRQRNNSQVKPERTNDGTAQS